MTCYDLMWSNDRFIREERIRPSASAKQKQMSKPQVSFLCSQTKHTAGTRTYACTGSRPVRHDHKQHTQSPSKISVTWLSPAPNGNGVVYGMCSFICQPAQPGGWNSNHPVRSLRDVFSGLSWDRSKESVSVVLESSDKAVGLGQPPLSSPHTLLWGWFWGQSFQDGCPHPLELTGLGVPLGWVH